MWQSDRVFKYYVDRIQQVAALVLVLWREESSSSSSSSIFIFQMQ